MEEKTSGSLFETMLLSSLTDHLYQPRHWNKLLRASYSFSFAKLEMRPATQVKFLFQNLT